MDSKPLGKGNNSVIENIFQSRFLSKSRWLDCLTQTFGFSYEKTLMLYKGRVKENGQFIQKRMSFSDEKNVILTSDTSH